MSIWHIIYLFDIVQVYGGRGPQPYRSEKETVKNDDLDGDKVARLLAFQVSFAA
jgi:hypothetical protein